MLGSRMDLADLRVLDLYAGTGALGLEAVSRGAASAVLVEADRRAAGVLRDNIAVCSAGARVRVVNRTAEAFVAAQSGVFDLIFLDPPYDVTTEQCDAVIAGCAAVLAPGGWIVVERARRSDPITWPAGIDEVATKQYGDTVVVVGGSDAPVA